MSDTHAGMPAPKRREPPKRIRIRPLEPVVDAGRYAPKRCVGDTVTVAADVFGDGHEKLRSVVRYKAPGGQRWLECEMEPVDAHWNGVRWEGRFTPETPGQWQFAVEAWIDTFATWCDELQRKVTAGQDDLAGELSEGRVMLAQAVGRAKDSDDKRSIQDALDALAEGPPSQVQFDAALSPELYEAVERVQERHGATRLAAPLLLEVDRVRARFSSWYELVPRSWGGLKAVEAQVPAIAELGFDVLYMLPIHPIGRTNRKGRNNTLVAGPDDPGSPYAVGGEEGGHDAVHPDLGTVDDVRSLCATAREHGMDVCMDFAINASADHPWLAEHPEWFHRRPDGTLKYAENPPKKYQDIYNVNFESEDRQGLWEALRDVMLYWVARGVRVFRVDNPHTKPVAFWEWLIAEVRRVQPELVLLSEAFTRPAMMTTLAKVGFSQSYTYFTWKNTRAELVELMGQILEWNDYYRPNFFTNTPDILHEYLQAGGRPAFEARLALAATLSPAYGIYSGYESVENVPVREGSEEYLDSEKYEAKRRKLDGPLLPLVQRLNELRRAEPALQRVDNLRWIETEQPLIVGYVKDDVVVVVNVDPLEPRDGLAIIPAASGLPPTFFARDLLGGERYRWTIGRNYVRLDPGQAHIFKLETHV